MSGLTVGAAVVLAAVGVETATVLCVGRAVGAVGIIFERGAQAESRIHKIRKLKRQVFSILQS